MGQTLPVEGSRLCVRRRKTYVIRPRTQDLGLITYVVGSRMYYSWCLVRVIRAWVLGCRSFKFGFKS